MDKQALEKKLEFYQQAYQTISGLLIKDKEAFDGLSKQFEAFSKEVTGKWIGISVEPEEEVFLNQIGISTQKAKEELEKRIKERMDKIANYEADARYREYLELSIAPELDVVKNLEQNEVFNYFLAEGFNDPATFINKPRIDFRFFVYEPRKWKFEKAANELAKIFYFENYQEMFQTWATLRQSFDSLLNNQKFAEVIAQCEVMRKEVETLKEKNKQVETEEIEIYIGKITGLMQSLQEQSLLKIFTQDETHIIQDLKERMARTQKSVETQQNDSSIILKNMDFIEQTIEKFDFIKWNKISEEDQNKIISAPANEPIFKIIPEAEWEDIKIAFAKKGIDLNGDRKDYTMTETDLTEEEREKLMKKYNVKVGEVFFDESLRTP